MDKALYQARKPNKNGPCREAGRGGNENNEPGRKIYVCHSCKQIYFDREILELHQKSEYHLHMTKGSVKSTKFCGIAHKLASRKIFRMGAA